jgi:hypothetical protein
MTAGIATDGRPDAVVWIDERHAIIARSEPQQEISTVEIRRLARPENRYLAQVVHEMTGRERVMVIGPEPIRLALERRFVSVSHRPERLMAPPPETHAGSHEVLDPVGVLAA